MAKNCVLSCSLTDLILDRWAAGGAWAGFSLVHCHSIHVHSTFLTRFRRIVMEPANPEIVAKNVFFSIIVCCGGFILATLMVIDLF